MLSYVLNDRGEKFIKTSTVNDKKFKKPFNWQSLSIITLIIYIHSLQK